MTQALAHFAPVVLEAALRAVLAAVVVWTGLRVLRVENVPAQKTAWALVLVAALVMPFGPHRQLLPWVAAMRLPAMPWMQRPAAAAQPAQASAPPDAYAESSLPRMTTAAGDSSRAASIPRTSLPADGMISAPLAASPAGTVPAATAATNETARNETAPPAAPEFGRASRPGSHSGLVAWASIAYLGIVGILLLRLAAGLASAARLWFTATPVVLSDMERPDRLLRASRRVASPVNIGSGVVLPTDYASWDEEKLRIVLAHERSHIRQGDFYLQLLAGVYACLFWFSPLGWWLKRKLYELGEAISDRAGLEEAASRSSYAQLLLEFAALPRPTLTGVAMARTSHLAQRIERLLNESSFRQSFATGGRRALLAVLLVPAGLFAATALVRVEAATPAAQAPAAAPADLASQAAIAGQATPDQVTDQAPAISPVPAPGQVAVPAPAAETVPVPPSTEAQPQPAPPAPQALPPGIAVAPLVPLPPGAGAGAVPVNPVIMGAMPPMPPTPGPHQDRKYAYAYGYGQQGDPYAIVDGDGKIVMPTGIAWGDWNGASREGIDKARRAAHGAFLYFEHDGKSYIVDDPALVAQIKEMNKPMEDLHSQMEALGKQMRDLGQQQKEQGMKMRDVNVQTPDLSKEIADLNAAMEALKAKQGSTISQKDLGELQREIGRVQGELGGLQGKIGAQQGEFGKQMGQFGEQMGKFGGQMGKLGAQMGQIARENHTKIEGMITDSLSNGKAKPVQ